ncbi:MAG: bifunctional UDP-N-acetylglucosamine diphosphorylase/glucosamine-1-phosphate N-acetyltransferase GlmU [Hyphomicrobiales bacterium]|nr:bifunctional UDP-N-acetylglucosamine diphosphorylase/glucosamine-1-phosphate N-acetyltransferase GlmU [Hyphomicrobiales bacterium]
MGNNDAPAAATRPCLTLVLAAGEGKRMRSALPKVLHHVAGRAMLAHVLDAAPRGRDDDVAVIVGPDRGDVAAAAQASRPGARIFTQAERRGTAHAVLAARAAIEAARGDVIIAYGDMPLILPETLSRLQARRAQGAALVVLGFHAADPTGYGRLLQKDDQLVAIREERDATAAERAVSLCNSGLMAFDGAVILSLLDAIGNANSQGEFYLTDAVEIAVARGLSCAVELAGEAEVKGVNDRVQLAEAEALMQERLRRAAMLAGATLVDPPSVHLSFDSKIGADVIIEPQVYIGPGVSIEGGAIIHASSNLEGVKIGAGVHVGPFARLRPGAVLEKGAKVGNFVEVKAARIGAGAKVSHLSYIGDADIGADANIGAGVITCNYDGFLKYRTTVGAGAFVGSNSALVAPVTIGAGAYVGSGSVITRDVGADALALERSQQLEKPGWAQSFRARRLAMKAKGRS